MDEYMSYVDRERLRMLRGLDEDKTWLQSLLFRMRVNRKMAEVETVSRAVGILHAHEQAQRQIDSDRDEYFRSRDLKERKLYADLAAEELRLEKANDQRIQLQLGQLHAVLDFRVAQAAYRGHQLDKETYLHLRREEAVKVNKSEIGKQKEEFAAAVEVEDLRSLINADSARKRIRELYVERVQIEESDMPQAIKDMELSDIDELVESLRDTMKQYEMESAQESNGQDKGRIVPDPLSDPRVLGHRRGK